MCSMLTLGIDEVGRGCWAGPLVVAGVLLDASAPQYRDSKTIHAKRRRVLAEEIEAQQQYVLAWVEACVIDEVGIAASMRRAVAQVLTALMPNALDQHDTRIVLDGTVNYAPLDYQVETIARADDSVSAVAAASIVAKVARDQFMIDQARLFPDFAFDKHVGYGTAAHRSALQRYGLTSLHRKSFQPMKTMDFPNNSDKHSSYV